MHYLLRFYSVLIVKHRLQKDVNNDIYSSVDCVIYDEHNDWFNNLNCIRFIFEGLINVSKAGINFVLEIYKIKWLYILFKCVAAISVHFCINRHFNYIKVLPFIIKYVGIAINKITRMGRLESYFAISTAIFG